MAKITFSDIKIRNLPLPKTGQKTYWDAAFPTFGVRVSQGGAKTFVLNRKNTFITIGKYGIIGLSDARAEARRVLAEFTLGRLLPRSIPYHHAVDLFLADKAKSKRARTVRGYRRFLEKYFKFTGKLPEISHHDIETHLKRIKAPSEYNHALACAKTFFTWCVKKRLITDNPTTGMSLNRRPSRSRILTDAELKRVWHASVKCGDFGAIVRLLILTGQRRGEISVIRGEWIDRNTCTLPKEITKNGREHTFPLSKTAASILSDLSARRAGLLFPARGKLTPFNGWSKAKSQLDTLSRVNGWTLHDLRRTFATNLAKLGTPIHITERLLNHVSGTQGGIVAVYQRHEYADEMREAVDKYENYLLKLFAH